MCPKSISSFLHRKIIQKEASQGERTNKRRKANKPTVEKNLLAKGRKKANIANP